MYSKQEAKNAQFESCGREIMAFNTEVYHGGIISGPSEVLNARHTDITGM
jgi:hypothetical protein